MFGKYNPDGSIETDVDVCVLTGQAIEPGDTLLRFTGTPYFVRISAAAVRSLTAEKRAALESLLPSAGSAAAAELSSPAAESLYPAPSIDELSSSGRRSKFPKNTSEDSES